MRMKFASIWVPVAVLGLVFLTACDSIRVASDNAAIRTAVFKDNVLNHSLSDSNNFQVYFLDVDSDREASELKYFFATNNPPVVCGTNQALYTQKGVFDRSTGGEGEVFSVEIESVEYPNASVLAEAYAGPYMAEIMDYSLTFTNNEWTVTGRVSDDDDMNPDSPAQ